MACFRTRDHADTGAVHRREREFASQHGRGFRCQEAGVSISPSGKPCMVAADGDQP